MKFDLVPLGQLCVLRYGKDHKKLRDGPFPVFGSGGIMRYVDHYLSNKPSVLIPRIGSLSNLFYVDRPFWTINTIFWTEIDETRVLPKFLYYSLLSKSLENLNIGSSVPSVNSDTLNKVLIPLPPVAYQREVVDILEPFERKISLNNGINDNLSNLIVAIYQQMFTAHKFPVKTLGELFSISIGKTPPRKEFEWFSNDNKGIKWASISDLGCCGTYIGKTSEQLTEEAIKRFNIPIVEAGTVLLSFKLTVGRVAISDAAMCTNEAIASFQERRKHLTLYLYCFLKNFNFRTLGSTSSIANAINSKIVKSIVLPVPPHNEIEAFNTLVAPLFEQIRNLQRENAYLSEIRDILIPKLLKTE